MTVGAFVTADSVKQLQADIRADWTALHMAVLAANAAQPGGQRGPGQLTDTLLSEWDAFSGRVQSYLTLDPSTLTAATQMDQGQAIQQDLATWHTRLASAGVDVGPAPSKGPTSGIENMFHDVLDSPVLLAAVGFLILREVHDWK